MLHSEISGVKAVDSGQKAKCKGQDITYSDRGHLPAAKEKSKGAINPTPNKANANG